LVERLARLRVPLGFVFGLVVLVLARPTMSSVTVGGLVALVGECLRVWASGHLNKAREVTSSGPYRWLAHPLYVGSSIMGVGLAIASQRAIAGLIIAGYLLLTLTAAVRSEEAFLRRTFGDGYEQYRSGVIDAASRFQLSQALTNSEHRTVLGVLLVLLVLLMKALYGV
jgi:protein-S-isoprenylcysteine O-methyltransferase Ste14